MVLRVFQRLQVSCAKHLLSFLVKETMRYGIAIRTMKLMIAYHHAIFEFVSLLPGVTLWRQYQLILFFFSAVANRTGEHGRQCRLQHFTKYLGLFI